MDPASGVPAAGFLVKSGQTPRFFGQSEMSDQSQDEKQAAKAALREQQARDAELAMRDYEAEKLAVAAKTARLRALRLAKEAGETAPKSTGRKRPAE